MTHASYTLLVKIWRNHSLGDNIIERYFEYWSLDWQSASVRTNTSNQDYSETIICITTNCTIWHE